MVRCVPHFFPVPQTGENVVHIVKEILVRKIFGKKKIQMRKCFGKICGTFEIAAINTELKGGSLLNISKIHRI